MVSRDPTSVTWATFVGGRPDLSAIARRATAEGERGTRGIADFVFRPEGLQRRNREIAGKTESAREELTIYYLGTPGL